MVVFRKAAPFLDFDHSCPRSSQLGSCIIQKFAYFYLVEWQESTRSSSFASTPPHESSGLFISDPFCSDMKDWVNVIFGLWQIWNPIESPYRAKSSLQQCPGDLHQGSKTRPERQNRPLQPSHTPQLQLFKTLDFKPRGTQVTRDCRQAVILHSAPSPAQTPLQGGQIPPTV